jgi:hypothetical protein
VTAAGYHPLLKCGSDRGGGPKLANGHCILQVVSSEQDPRQIIGDGAEPRDAQGLAPQLFEPVDFRLHVKSMIGPIGGSRDTENGCSVQDSIDDSVGRRTSSLKISADESLDDHGSGGDIDELGMNPLLLKGSNLFRHPKTGGHGSDAGIT